MVELGKFFQTSYSLGKTVPERWLPSKIMFHLGMTVSVEQTFGTQLIDSRVIVGQSWWNKIGYPNKGWDVDRLLVDLNFQRA